MMDMVGGLARIRAAKKHEIVTATALARISSDAIVAALVDSYREHGGVVADAVFEARVILMRAYKEIAAESERGAAG